MNHNLTGIILSGGKSIRMGENKAFIEIEGIPIIQRIQTLFERLFDEIIIVTQSKRTLFKFKCKNLFRPYPKPRCFRRALYWAFFFFISISLSALLVICLF